VKHLWRTRWNKVSQRPLRRRPPPRGGPAESTDGRRRGRTATAAEILHSRNHASAQPHAQTTYASQPESVVRSSPHEAQTVRPVVSANPAPVQMVQVAPEPKIVTTPAPAISGGEQPVRNCRCRNPLQAEPVEPAVCFPNPDNATAPKFAAGGVTPLPGGPAEPVTPPAGRPVGAPPEVKPAPVSSFRPRRWFSALTIIFTPPPAGRRPRAPRRVHPGAHGGAGRQLAGGAAGLPPGRSSWIRRGSRRNTTPA